MEELLAILGIVGFVYAAVTLATYTNTVRMAEVSLMLYPNAEPPQDADEWAANNDFKFIGNYIIKTGATDCLISAWKRLDRPTSFCRYVVSNKNKSKTTHDLTTIFAHHIGLTTCDTMDGNLFPAFPGSYKQSFSNISLDHLWAHHIEMENYLMDKGKAQLLERDVSFEQDFNEATQKQIKFIRSLPFWPFRGAYWYFIRRRIWHNKSIKTQHEKGMIKLPNEISEEIRQLCDFINRS